MTSVSQSTRITQNEVLPALGRCDRSVSIEHEESAQPVTYFLFHRSAQNDVVEETWSQGRLMKSMSDTPITEEDLFADEDPEVPEEPEVPEVPEVPEDFTTEAPIEEPLTDSSTFDPLPDEQTESPYKFDAKCSCYMKSWAMRAPVDSSPLLGRLLTEAPKPEHCNNQGMKDCIAFCRENVHEVTNDFDLTKVPNTDDGSVTVSLGQYLCNLVDRHIFPQYMQTYAQMDCRSTYGSSHSIISKHVASTGSYSKQPLVCIRGIFYRGSLNA